MVCWVVVGLWLCAQARQQQQEARVLGDFNAPSGTNNVLNAKKNDIVQVLQQVTQ